MAQPKNNSRSWWQKITEIWSEKSALGQASVTPIEHPERASQQKAEFKTIQKSTSEQAPVPMADHPDSNPNLVSPEHREQPETIQTDKVISSAYKERMTQYERFVRRMARREQEAIESNQGRLSKTLTREERDKKKRAADAKRLLIVREHKEALRLKKMQCRNTWGRLESDEWNRILEQFLRTVLRASRDDLPLWRKQINSIVGPALLKKAKLSRVSVGSSFEFEVAAQLRSLGWTVQLLGKSGDQGGDLLAQKNNKNVVVQCKNFSSSKVGNAAVQEVAAAKQFYHASAAVVICPNGFTRQAQALADKTCVLLLAPDQLSVLG
ncbi:MAG: restriction endonuclease [Verrucomicrobia bacterium]|nr:restriction endonuclease [Verrucomicrobiota bacterium]